MEDRRFSYDIQNSYIQMHELVVKAKYYFLKVVQFNSIDDNKKNDLRDIFIDLSKDVGDHFQRIKYAKINNYNINEYEKLEVKFVNTTKARIEKFIKTCRRTAPVGIDYNRSNINEKKIDEDILDSKIYGTRALDIDKLKSIDGFYDYLRKLPVEPENNRKHEKKKSVAAVESDLIELKIENFKQKLNNAEEPEIFYKAKLKIEKSLIEGKRTTIYNIDEYAKTANLNEDEIYLVYDQSYNIEVLYKNGTTLIVLNLKLIDEIIERDLLFHESIGSEVTVGEETVRSVIYLPEKYQRCSIEEYNKVFQELLDYLEIRDIFERGADLIRNEIEKENRLELEMMEKAKAKVNAKLDELL